MIATAYGFGRVVAALVLQAGSAADPPHAVRRLLLTGRPFLRYDETTATNETDVPQGTGLRMQTRRKETTWNLP